ncbi:MAG: diguanylate cyclase [Gammaproteobacteria bacterium]
MLEQLTPPQLISMLNAAPIGVLLLDADGKVNWMNERLAEALGPRGLALIGAAVDNVDDDLRDLFKTEGEVCLGATTWLSTSHELPGQYQARYLLDSSNLLSLLNEREQLRAQVEALSVKDPATGLLNRRGILQALEPQVSRSRRYNNLLSVLTIKIANYAALQQQLSADELNTLMLAISQVLNDQMRWADAIGRLDEDEILMVLPETEANTAQQLADKIQTRLAELLVPALADRKFEICTRFGMAQWQKGEDAALLMRHAREMMEHGVEARVAINA